jgi:hypothetical protein
MSIVTAVLSERALRLVLFGGSTPRVGEGLPGILTEVVAPPEAEAPRSWSRLFQSPSPLKALHEAIVDVTHWEQLTPHTWIHAVSLGEAAAPAATGMICDDVANGVPPQASDAKEKEKEKDGYAVCRVELVPVSIKDRVGHFYCLCPAGTGAAPEAVPITLVVRVRRRLLARAAWLRLQKSPGWRQRIKERRLALDRCVNLQTYSVSPSVPIRLSWTHVTMTSNGRRESLCWVQTLFQRWFKCGANVRVFTRVWQVGVSELAKEDIPLLVALLRIGFWVIFSHKHDAQPVRIQIVDAPDAKAIAAALEDRSAQAAKHVAATPLLYQLLEGLLRLDPLILPPLRVSYVYTAETATPTAVSQ